MIFFCAVRMDADHIYHFVPMGAILVSKHLISSPTAPNTPLQTKQNKTILAQRLSEMPQHLAFAVIIIINSVPRTGIFL